MGKKLLGLALALVLVLTLVPTGARAATSGSWTYTVSDGEATITGFTGAGSSVMIPSTLGGYPVTEIGVGAFSSCTGLTMINAAADHPAFRSEDGILFSKDKTTLILYPAGRSGSYTVPDGIINIDASAFQGCTGLTAVTIPRSVAIINPLAFYGCTGLTVVTLPRSIPIGPTPCSAPTVGVCYIGIGAFGACTGLTAINVDADHPAYCSVDGVLFSKDKTALIQYPAGRSGSYTIPNSVSIIAAKAFEGCTGLTSVTIPGSVTDVASEAFRSCTGLTSVTISNSVTEIADAAFKSCTRLSNVYYSGTQAEWAQISMGSSNEPLTSANIHYSGASAPLAVTSVTASKSSVSAGTAVTWTASASGGSGSLRYCFYVFNGNTVVQRGSYSTARTYTYTPATAGTYTVRVYVKDGAGTVVSKDKAAAVSVSAAALSIGSVTASKSAVPAGTAVTWTASASGGSGTLQYCFYVFKDGKIAQRGAYGTARTYTYTPATAGNYTVRVYVKDGAGTTVTKDKAAAVSVSAAALSIGSVTVSKSAVTAGTSVTWTASASGGSGTLQYCFYVFKDGKIAQRGSYSAARTYTYTPATAGKYTVRVYVKDSAGTAVTKDNAAPVTVS